MTAVTRPTSFGRIHALGESRLAGRPPEPILEPGLPIVDTHHHLREHLHHDGRTGVRDLEVPIGWPWRLR